MIEQILSDLLSLSTENEVVEFKEAKDNYRKDKLGEYFSALSNEANLKGLSQAWIVMGVRNDKSIVGTNISDDQINEFKHEITQHTSPRSSFVNVHRTVREGKNVLLFEIPPAPRGIPVSWKGHRYGRDGESIGGLNDRELDAIKAQNNMIDWSAQVIENATMDDLSKEAIDFARIQFIEKNQKLKNDIEGWSDEEFLNKTKLTIRSKITRTTILLLGKQESEHYINPATSRISWILKDGNNIEKDYEHFSCPLLLSVVQVRKKIRNLKYRYIKSGSLFPDEVDQYDEYTIREALNNCIAHQDYTMGGKIFVVENETGTLTFTNSGKFIPSSIEEVVTTEAPEPKYRNTFLANAMVNLNMIDTIGSGIKKMFLIQKSKFFPLPEYDLSNNKVQVTIIGKVLDLKYAHKLAEIPSLSLQELIYLDKVAKRKILTEEEARVLKQKKLIEGRKPNFHISSDVALVTGEQTSYMKQRGIDDGYCQKMILEYLEKFSRGDRENFETLLLDKLPDVLSTAQKKNKIKNNLQLLRKQGIIRVENKIWSLSRSK
jgi:ATP-dependent DNA helicase RecG